MSEIFVDKIVQRRTKAIVVGFVIFYTFTILAVVAVAFLTK
jgi:hypothetical protein